MEYSCFASYGALEFVDDIAPAEKIYNSMVASYSHPVTGLPVIDMTVGSYHESKIYARAMAIADADAATRRAGNQENPLTADESLPVFEAELRISPNPTASIESRRAAVAARRVNSRGSRRESIYDVLTQVLGASLLAVRPILSAEATQWPASPALGPGVFGRNETPAKVVRLIDPVTTIGAPTTITYENWDTTLPPLQLVKGDVVAVQPENLGLAEKVTIASVTTVGTVRTLTTTFAKGHDSSASATTGPAPIWTSDAGHMLIVVTAAAALNADLCGRVHDAMTRLAKGGTTWSIVEPTSPGASTVGPFTLDSSPLGAVSIGTLSIVAPAPAPRLGPCVPAFGPTAGGTLVTLYGRYFTSASSVHVDGVAVAFTVQSDGTITFTTAAHANGGVVISVTTPSGTTTSPSAGPFPYGFGLEINSVTPTSGPNAGGTPLTVRGSGFNAVGLPVTIVAINGFALSGGFVIVNDNTITCTTDALAPGTYFLTVDNGVVTASITFTAI